MKNTTKLCVLLLVVMGLSSCHFSIKSDVREEAKITEKKTNIGERDQASDRKDKSQDRDSKEKTLEKDDSEPVLSDKEATKKLYDDYTGYVNRLTKEIPDYETIILNDVKGLVEISESQFYQTLYTKKAFGYGQMRERYPGIYKIYLIFESDAEREKYEKGEEGSIKQNILYINTITGKSFIDSGEIGIYALSDLEQVAFAADAMYEFTHVDLLLWVLKNKGIISNIYDYGSTLDFEDVSVLAEYEDSFPELGGEPDGVIFRYPIYDFLNKKVVGYYDFDLANRKIWNSHTGEVIYEDPLVQIEEKKITAENAVEETVRILHDLYYLENPEEYSYSAQADNLGDIFGREGFVITIRSKGKEAEVEPVIARYFITEDGRRVYLYDEASDTYYAIYGTALWYEN